MFKKQLPFRQAILFITVFTFVFFILTKGGIAIYKKNRKKTWKDPGYNISFILQTGTEKKALATDCLAEFMYLSIDEKTHFFMLDEKKAEKNLLKLPLIKHVKVKKIKPNIVYIDYELRKPIANLYDFENAAIDEEGNVFFLSPYIKQKDICEVYLGLPSLDKMKSKEKEFHLAKKILYLFQDKTVPSWISIKKIDVSNAFSESYGKKEIILTTEEILQAKNTTLILPKLIRLNVQKHTQQLGNFIVLCKKMRKDYEKQLIGYESSATIMQCKAKIIDLRIPELAYIKEDG